MVDEVSNVAELWQSYGTWILYALFFLAFLWMHGRMHAMGAGHGAHSGCGGSLAGPPSQPKGQQPAAGSTGRPHDGHTSERSSPHRHGC